MHAMVDAPQLIACSNENINHERYACSEDPPSSICARNGFHVEGCGISVFVDSELLLRCL